MKPPKPTVKKAKKSILQKISIVWIVPLLALLVVIAVAWQSYSEQGPLIEISFKEAGGIKAGATELRYRDVTVGLVEDVGFTDGLDRVLVSIRIDKAVAPYIDASSRFWVVRPQVSAQGISGLDTVLSGVYIAGLWDQEPGGMQKKFNGLADIPLEGQGGEGLRLMMRAAGKASLSENTPIFYRGVTVGRIGKPEISEDGSAAQAAALIYAPHDRLITTSTRFWDASGFSFSFGPNGAALDFTSVASLVSGGVTFDTMVSGGDPVEANAAFTVYPEEASARVSIFASDEGEILPLSVVFSENTAGLAADAPVELNGLRIGTVTALNARIDKKEFGDDRVRLVTSLAIQPGRLGLEDSANAEAALEYLRHRVENGLRARLATASILTGGLKIELIDVPDAPPAEIEDGEEDIHYIPTTDSEIADVSATAQGVFERINALPIEEVMISATRLFEDARTLMGKQVQPTCFIVPHA